MMNFQSLTTQRRNASGSQKKFYDPIMDLNTDTDEESSFSTDASEYDYSVDDDSYGSEGTSITHLDLMSELQLWMKQIAVAKIPRTTSMPVFGTNGGFKEKKISHHLVMERMRRCNSEFFQSPEAVTTTRRDAVNPAVEKPAERLLMLFKEAGYNPDDCGPSDDSFMKITEEHVKAHTYEVTNAARLGNLEKLAKFHAEGKSLDCCNKHGESIAHIACRIGSVPLLKFLLEEVGVTVVVRDDFGRTPMHDACWTDKPNFELVKILMYEDPKLMLTRDRRGYLPLAYVPRQRWAEWSEFIETNTSLLLEAASK